MTHIDRENLALIAMTEFDLTEPERQHLAECPECSLELIALQHTVAVGRSARTVELVEPANSVWAGIHADLGLSDAVAATPGRADYKALDPFAPVVGPVETPSAPVTEIGLRPRRRRRNWMPVAVAAGIAGLLGGLGGGIWWQTAQQQAPEPVLLAEARLDPYPGWDATGRASVKKTADGHREVVLDVSGANGDTDLREVWLIKADASGLISIGLLDGESGRFLIPDGVDLSQYPLVDVSAEPDDGDPQHSGDSILRGELRTV